MKWILATFGGLATVAAMSLMTPAAAHAEMSNSQLLARIEALEAELAQQRTDFVSYSMGGEQKAEDYGKGKCDDCPSRMMYATYELAVLRPYISDVQAGPGFDNEYGVGHRFIVGGESSSGLGARVRYLMYNHGHDGVLGNAGLTIGIDLDVVDLEATLSERLYNWDLQVAGGVRYGRLGLGFPNLPEVRFEGVGPTFAVQAVREVGSRGLHLVGNFRASLLMGEIHSDLTVIEADDEITTVLESQLGVGWTRDFDRAALDLHAVWETQFWMNDSFADDIFGFGSNVAFSGVVVAAQVRL